MAGVEAPLRAVHLGAGAQNRPIEVDRQPRQTGALDLVVHQVPNQVGEPLEGRRGEGLQPGDHRAIRGRAVKPREAQQDGIDSDEGQMADAKPPDHQKADQQQHHPHRAVVAVERGISEQNADPARKVDGD
jgi:hypothetical protein